MTAHMLSHPPPCRLLDGGARDHNRCDMKFRLVVKRWSEALTLKYHCILSHRTVEKHRSLFLL